MNCRRRLLPSWIGAEHSRGLTTEPAQHNMIEKIIHAAKLSEEIPFSITFDYVQLKTTISNPQGKGKDPGPFHSKLVTSQGNHVIVVTSSF